MLHLEYGKKEYKGSRIVIAPGNDIEIPGLRDMVFQNLMVENPARTFAVKYKGGGYEEMCDDEICEEAEVANVLSDLWAKEQNMNVMMLLARALQEIANLKLQKDALKPYEYKEKE